VHLDRESEPEKRERDRSRTDERRQKCRDEPAEDPEREQEDERKRDQLGPLEVILNRLGDLTRGDRAAPQPNLRIVGERIGQPIGSVLRGIVAPGLEEHEDDAVSVDDRAGDGRILVDPAPDTRDRCRPASDERKDPRICLDARSLLDLDVRETALGCEVGELLGARIHQRDHRAPEGE